MTIALVLLALSTFLPTHAQEAADCSYYISFVVEGEDNVLLVMSMPDQEIVAEIPADVLTDVTSMSWSPDGQRLLWGDNDGYSLLNVESGDVTPLFDEGDDVNYVTWFGDEIMFIQYDITIMTSPAHPQAVVDFFYYSDIPIRQIIVAGERVFVQTEHYITFVEDGETHEVVIDDPENLFPLSASPDGRWLAFGHSDEQSLYIMNLDAPDEVSEFEFHTHLNTAKWSPDSSQIAFGVGQGLFILDLASGESEARFTSPEAQVWASGWTPDGRGILINSTYQSILYLDVETDDLTRLSPRDHYANAAVSPCIAADE